MKMCERHPFVFVVNDPSPVHALDKAPIRANRCDESTNTSQGIFTQGTVVCKHYQDRHSYHSSGDILYTLFRRFR